MGVLVLEALAELAAAEAKGGALGSMLQAEGP